MQVQFQLNGKPQNVDVPPDMPLLWLIRDILNLKGTKYGCGVGACGACTVHMDGEAIRSCQMPAEALEGVEITTIEGLGSPEAPHPVQAAWAEIQVAQCGYCQSGQMMQAAALLETNPNPSDEDIDEALWGNLCRCGTYPRIRTAVKAAAKSMGETL